MDREVAAIADGCTKGGHNKSARAAYMRAAAYFTVALSSADGTKDPAGLLGPTFGEHRRCFDAYAELMDPPAEKVGKPSRQSCGSCSTLATSRTSLDSSRKGCRQPHGRNGRSGSGARSRTA